jgi:hypothetical protein
MQKNWPCLVLSITNLVLCPEMNNLDFVYIPLFQGTFTEIKVLNSSVI